MRVVWTTGLTIETFSPTRRFTSVDLPALVRPTTAMTPACGAGAPALASASDVAAAPSPRGGVSSDFTCDAKEREDEPEGEGEDEESHEREEDGPEEREADAQGPLPTGAEAG